jgi:prepilin-type N-terminal cleavage/methylation domain-containing protein
MNRRSNARRGFTITELLVVIVIFVLVVGIAIPAFKSMIASTERSLAENQLKVGLAAARDAAIQSPASDAAAVFFFQPGGRVSIVPCVSVGVLEDDVGYRGQVQGSGAPERREVFVPIATSTPVQLPKDWSVRGYTPPNTISLSQAPIRGAPPNGWYDSMAADEAMVGQGLWVFPETGFIDATENGLGWQRQTFMVRFRNGTGELDSGNRSLALVIDVVPQTEFRDDDPAPPTPARLDLAIDLPATVKRVLDAGIPNGLSRDQQARQRERLLINILGDASNDSVLARPVTELALYDERSLAAALSEAIGMERVNPVTGTFYADPAAGDGPALDRTLGVNSTLFDVTLDVSRWIQGELTAGGRPVTTDARIFTLQRYLGRMQELAE